jgi:hypothetical protein
MEKSLKFCLFIITSKHARTLQREKKKISKVSLQLDARLQQP